MALSVKTSGVLAAPDVEDNTMVKIKMTVNTRCGGEKVKVGQVVDCTAADGRLLINLGKAEPFVGEAKAPAKKTAKVSTRAKK